MERKCFLYISEGTAGMFESLFGPYDVSDVLGCLLEWEPPVGGEDVDEWGFTVLVFAYYSRCVLQRKGIKLGLFLYGIINPPGSRQ